MAVRSKAVARMRRGKLPVFDNIVVCLTTIHQDENALIALLSRSTVTFNSTRFKLATRSIKSSLLRPSWKVIVH